MSLRLSLVTAVLVCAVPAAAFAQPLNTAPVAPAPAPAVYGEGTATTFAVASTLAGWGLLFAAEDNAALGWTAFGLITIGPAAGHIYAGEYGHAALTSLLRAGTIGAAVVGVIVAVFSEDSDGDGEVGVALMVGGGLGLIGVSCYDLFDAHKAARRANAREALRLAPTTFTAADGGRSYGLALSGRF